MSNVGLIFPGDLGKAVSELVTAMTDDDRASASDSNSQWHCVEAVWQLCKKTQPFDKHKMSTDQSYHFHAVYISSNISVINIHHILDKF